MFIMIKKELLLLTEAIASRRSDEQEALQKDICKINYIWNENIFSEKKIVSVPFFIAGGDDFAEVV